MSGLSVTVKHIIHFSVYIVRYIFRYTFRCTGYWYIEHYLFVNRIGSLLYSYQAATRRGAGTASLQSTPCTEKDHPSPKK